MRLLFTLLFISSTASSVALASDTPVLDAISLEGEPTRVELTGRVTILDFFATWCPRCRESVSSYQDLARQFGDRLQIVVVDVGEPAELVAEYFAAHPLPAGATLLLDPDGQVMRRFGPPSFPSFFVIDERGTVKAVMRGWGPSSAGRLAHHVGSLLGKRGARAGSGRVSRPPRRPPPRPTGISADEHARRIGVEVLR